MLIKEVVTIYFQKKTLRFLVLFFNMFDCIAETITEKFRINCDTCTNLDNIFQNSYINKYGLIGIQIQSSQLSTGLIFESDGFSIVRSALNNVRVASIFIHISFKIHINLVHTDLKVDLTVGEPIKLKLELDKDEQKCQSSRETKTTQYECMT